MSIEIDHPRCPFCHEAVKPADEGKQSCASCMAWHHLECWDTHGGCSICSGRDSSVSDRSAPQKEPAGKPGTTPYPFLALVAGLVVLVLGGVVSWVTVAPVPPPPPIAQVPPVQPHQDKTWHLRFMEANSEEEKTRWCRVGSEEDDPAAMNLLGFRLAGGIGCTQDSVEAVKWGRKGAEMGHSNAMFGLAMMLEGGHGVPADEKEAVYWYRRALEAGDPQAPHHLEKLLKKRPDLR